YLYHYTEYPAIYEKDRVVGQLRGARPGESKEETQKRGDREFSELQQSPFFKIWACAGVDQILSGLHQRLLLGPSAWASLGEDPGGVGGGGGGAGPRAAPHSVRIQALWRKGS